MLGELLRFRFGIAIAGTHGKTTTTSLVTSVLTEAHLDPTFVIGGMLNSAGTHAKLGNGKYLVAEADESDASFLYLHPMMTVVTNIDADHMETYGGNFETLRLTFLKFLENLPFYGLAIVCLDDPVIRRSLPEISRPMLTYGFSEDADIVVIADSCRYDGWTSRFKVKRHNNKDLEITLKLPGQHNILNACAAIAIAQELGIEDTALLKALENFSGVGRRLQHHGEISLGEDIRVEILDDYGHHPREVAVTLEALRKAYPHRRIVMVFQPHRYTRTRDLFKEFASVLSESDVLCLLDVYPAGEQPIPGADSEHLAKAILAHQKVKPILINNPQTLRDILKTVVENQDILLMQGAGNIGALAKELAKAKNC
jgi:UDP-N-acetylmuramate--alanine ligase